MGTLVWHWQEPSCESSYQQLFLGHVNMREKKHNSVSKRYQGALLTVVPKSAPVDDLPKSFGLSLHNMVGHCALQGYASNVDGVIVLILSPGTCGWWSPLTLTKLNNVGNAFF